MLNYPTNMHIVRQTNKIRDVHIVVIKIAEGEKNKCMHTYIAISLHGEEKYQKRNEVTRSQ